MDLRRQATARAAEGLLAAAPRAAGEALRLARRRVEHHRLERVGRDALEEELVPDALAGPATEASVDRPDLAESGGEVLPRDAGAQHVGHGLTNRRGVVILDSSRWNDFLPCGRRSLCP